MRKAEKASPTESPLLFEMDPEPAPEMLTALGGAPLVVQAFRSLGLPASVKRQVQSKGANAAMTRRLLWRASSC